MYRLEKHKNKMKEVKVKLYEFSELSEQAKEVARNLYRENNTDDASFIYDEARASVQAFHKIFGTKEGNRNWLEEIDFSRVKDQVLRLNGDRLQRYIWNNYRNDLWKGKYYSVKTKDHQIFHKRVETKVYKSGNIGNYYYSAITLDNCCPLTGVCYDDSLLKPMYDFLDARPEGSVANTTFEDIIWDCFEALKKDLTDEEEYMNSDRYINERLEESNNMFTENGVEFIEK